MLLCLLLLPMTRETHGDDRPRARDAGVRIGVMATGDQNAITDVAGVRVGHVTLVEGDSIRTDVTAILPHDGNLYQQKVPAAVFVGNGYGKLAGSTQVQELRTLESPIVLTNTLSVAAGIEGVVTWTLEQDGTRRCAPSTRSSARPTTAC